MSLLWSLCWLPRLLPTKNLNLKMHWTPKLNCFHWTYKSAYSIIIGEKWLRQWQTVTVLSLPPNGGKTTNRLNPICFGLSADVKPMQKIYCMQCTSQYIYVLSLYFRWYPMVFVDCLELLPTKNLNYEMHRTSKLQYFHWTCKSAFSIVCSKRW
jgi:hypothetical protein